MGRRKSGGGGGGDGLIVVAIVALLIVVVLAIAIPLVLPVAWLIFEMRRSPTPGGPDPFGLTTEERDELARAERRRQASEGAHQLLRREARGHKKRGDGMLDARNARARELNDELPAAAAADEFDTGVVDELVHRPIERWNRWASVLRDKWGMRLALVFGVGAFVACAWMHWTRYLEFFHAEGSELSRIPDALWAYARALASDLPAVPELIAILAPAGATLVGFAIGRKLGLARATAIIPIPAAATPVSDSENEDDSPNDVDASRVGAAIQVTQVPTLEAPLDVSGMWSSVYVYRRKSSEIAMDLEQTGTQITGTSGKSTITGEVDGRVFVGHWEEDGSRGGLQFEFSEDGQTFSGSWDTEGGSARGSWNGKRQP